ncbi:MAG: preprotein translocase subunit SecA [Nitrospirae bacterium CG_4_10_14_3_um_filter_44_29]|nr:MAG: preprotein translocase subunit SecA [Nitrospirae bacterium CG1_02_44_142]PIV40864.1 MAG: preprotein translocase subunit SecA [Nitrospirae bacterium CG02_land_8_20_14_3_00_44_33]PIX89614.1 MAG: preprotein translocase subunit SecA [Nitrospirae bacterium CG_4_10_14_3_um_filter_44_29]
MVNVLLKKLFGTKNEREIKRLLPLVARINSLEPKISGLSDSQLKDKTPEFKKRLELGETLDDILPEAFAVVREVSKRTLKMRHFDVQLLGGIALHEGKIAEMKTGEGKTLVATLPVYLNALEGKGVNIITVNDYLATRDARWMSPIYNFLGMSVGVIVHGLTDEQRQSAYNSDITFGTNNEFGFDYLRDNMKYNISQYVQRELNYAIVDEVDSILIDEARTPLIISGPSEESTDKYYNINKIIPKLQRDADYTIDEKAKTVILTEEGNIKVEKLLGTGNLYDPSNIELVHHVLQGLKAHTLFKRDIDYIVKDGEVIIVDEFTGRLMPGRRWSDGLHQAIEAKEGVKIESENQTLATITFQNYFRMYKKLAGMTGTADTEAEEFGKIYNLDVLVIPTNQPMIRGDFPDVIYKTEKGKFTAALKEIEELHKREQPVLVGTISIEKSEVLSHMLKKKGIPHSVLNAKYHEKEAEIIEQAGRSGAVTIATNMAGRGTDIVLGGNPDGLAKEFLRDKKDYTEEDYKQALLKADEICKKDREKVVSVGGLHILGTERHEARRIDNQLRGRSGRQGDPGFSRFYLSLEDDLMRIFGSDRISGLMNRLGMEEDMPIENKLVSRAIENAQKKVEAHNFDIRKQLLEYDDVMNKQRIEIYSFRREILQEEGLKDRIYYMAEETAAEMLNIYCPEEKHPEEWDMKGLHDAAYGTFSITYSTASKSPEEIRASLISAIKESYEKKEAEIGSEMMRYIEKTIMLEVVDAQWKDHLLAMDHLKEGIGLRGYGQRDPLTEYKKEAFEVFVAMTDRVSTEVLNRIFKIQVRKEEGLREIHKKQQLIYNKNETAEMQQPVRKGKKTGRNDPCPCGSGKKYKKCCGANA